MTSRFRALLRITALFAIAGIPVGVVTALWNAWRKAPALGDGTHFWSLFAGFAFDAVRLYSIIFALIGVVFGLWLSVAGRRVSRPDALGRATWLGILAGTVGGVAAYGLGGWGASESLATWIAGAASLGALTAAVGGGLAAGYFALASRAQRLTTTADKAQRLSPAPRSVE